MISNNDKFLEAISFVSNLTGTPTRKILSKKRDIDYVVPRHFLRYYLRKIFDMKLQSIGGFTNSHHATVIHSIKFVNDYSLFDKTYRSYKNSIDDLKESDVENKLISESLRLKVEVMEIIKRKNSYDFKCNQLLNLIQKENESSRTIK